jgi:hypothetical protein
MHYASKMYMGKTIEGFSGVGRFWGVFNRAKLPLSNAVRVEIAQPVLVHFQRIARRFIQSQMKASFLWKRALGKRVCWRRYRCGNALHHSFNSSPSRQAAHYEEKAFNLSRFSAGEGQTEFPVRTTTNNATGNGLANRPPPLENTQFRLARRAAWRLDRDSPTIPG